MKHIMNFTNYKKVHLSHQFRNNQTVIKRESWFTKNLLNSSKRKGKVLHVYRPLFKPIERSIAEFKQYNNMFNKLKQAMKIKSFRNSLEENKYNIKKTWTNLKQGIGTLNNKPSLPHTFLVNDISVTDKLKSLNNSIIIFPKLESKLV